MSRRFESAIMLWAALMGMAGVAMAAAAAHMTSASSLQAAALILLTHAPAVIACLVAARADLIRVTLGRGAAAMLAFGATLFSADIALRAFSGTPLFPMAAPAGGFILMFGWGLMAVATLTHHFQHISPRDKD
mgnify:CR=1 FL=1